MNNPITRIIDDLGRISLPNMWMKALGWRKGNEVMLHNVGSTVVIELAVDTPGCVFCNKPEVLVNYMNRDICFDCVTNITTE